MEITTSLIQSLGPLVDGIVGTAGEYQDLYEAMVSGSGPQWNNVLVTDGCTMSQDVTLTAENGSIISLQDEITLGSKTLRITGAGWTLQRIRVSSATGNGIEIATDRIRLIDCYILSNGGIGIKIESGNYTEIIGGTIYDNGGDGIEIADSCITKVVGVRIQANGAWGIDDNNTPTDDTMFIGNIITGNTSGQLSTNADAAYKISNKTS